MRWMWRGPHALSIQVGCAEVATGASSDARLESGDRRLCVCGISLFPPMAEEFELSLMLPAGRDFWRGETLATSVQLLVASFSFSPRLRWCRVLLGALFACVVVVVEVFAWARDV
jgi:hypothetical protein